LFIACLESLQTLITCKELFDNQNKKNEIKLIFGKHLDYVLLFAECSQNIYFIFKILIQIQIFFRKNKIIKGLFFLKIQIIVINYVQIK